MDKKVQTLIAASLAMWSFLSAANEQIKIIRGGFVSHEIFGLPMHEIQIFAFSIGIIWFVSIQWGWIKALKDKTPMDEEWVSIKDALVILVLDEDIDNNFQKFREMLDFVRKQAQCGNIDVWVEDISSDKRKLARDFFARGSGIRMRKVDGLNNYEITIQHTPTGDPIPFKRIALSQKDVMTLYKKLREI